VQLLVGFNVWAGLTTVLGSMIYFSFPSIFRLSSEDEDHDWFFISEAQMGMAVAISDCEII
jgi:hypothetical protein